jgi:ribosomal protein S18 acetylase RimI-like enzyme
MEEVAPGELFEASDDLFLRHRMDPVMLRRAWVRGAAIAALEVHPRYGETLTVLGSVEEASHLLGVLSERIRVHRVRLGADIPTPDGLALRTRAVWDWMTTDRRAPEPPDVEALDRRADGPEIHALLDADNPEAHGRPDDPRMSTWVGVRDGCGLVAAGALEWTGPGGRSGHLRAVTTRRSARGRGLGTAVSARLTNVALDGPAGFASLGVYRDNHAARAVYERLGYRRDRTLCAGTVEGG